MDWVRRLVRARVEGPLALVVPVGRSCDRSSVIVVPGGSRVDPGAAIRAVPSGRSGAFPRGRATLLRYLPLRPQSTPETQDVVVRRTIVPLHAVAVDESGIRGGQLPIGLWTSRQRRWTECGRTACAVAGVSPAGARMAPERRVVGSPKSNVRTISSSRSGCPERHRLGGGRGPVRRRGPRSAPGALIPRRGP
jgi:hypothetical protein